MKQILLSYLMIALFLLTGCQQQDEVETLPSTPLSSDRSLNEARVELEQLLDDVYGKQSTRTNEHGGKTILSSFSYRVCNQTHTRTTQPDSLTFYVFNFENNSGYAIMSGDRDMPSLYALVDSGNYTWGNTDTSNGSNLFLKGMTNLPKDPLVPDAGGDNNYHIIYGDWTNNIYKPGGYCKVRWNQWYPCNIFCPTIDGKTTPAGCVALAVSQLMSIFEYPQSYNGYSFDWTAMKSYPFASWCDNATKQQIGRIHQQLGLSKNLNITYGINGSGAKEDRITSTFKNFGYTNGGTIIKYKTESLIPELKNGYCAIVVGWASKEESSIAGIPTQTTYYDGHAWLCHGLLERTRTLTWINNTTKGIIKTTTETFYYPLCNWGWNGNRDGYYLSNVFDCITGQTFDINGNEVNNPDSSCYNFQYDLKTVINIRK